MKGWAIDSAAKGRQGFAITFLRHSTNLGIFCGFEKYLSKLGDGAVGGGTYFFLHLLRENIAEVITS